MPLSFAESADGIVLMANGVDPVQRWDGYSAAATPAGVEVPDSGTTPVLAGSGSGGITGTYVIFVRFVDEFGHRSNPSPFSAQVTVSAVGGFDYSNLPTPTEGTVTRRQILRNTAGQFNVFYVDIDTTDIASTSLSSTRTDVDLATQESQSIIDATGGSLFDRFARPPATIAVLAFHLGRMWGAAIEDYAEGSVSVTNGSANVTGTGVDWKDSFVGRFIHVLDGDKPYEIATVNPLAGTLTLTETYQGSTDPYAAYSIRSEPTVGNLVYFSEAGLPEAWPVDNALSLPEDGDRITALISVRSWLIASKRRRLYRITAQSDPRVDGFVYPSAGRGCVNQRTWVKVAERAYILDEQGIYIYDGQSAQPISTPIQDLFHAKPRGRYRINWRCSRYFHALYSPKEQVIRFFVTLNGGYLPRWALCYGVELERWWMEEYPLPVGGSTLGRLGRPTGSWRLNPDQPYLGGPSGRVFAVGGELDVLQQWQPTFDAEVTAAGAITVSPRRAISATVAGSPLVVTSGRGYGQVRVITRIRDDGSIEVDRPWKILPAVGDRVAVGAIPYRFRSHRLSYSYSEKQQEFSLSTGYEAVEWGKCRIRMYSDQRLEPDTLKADMGSPEDDGLSGKKGDDGYTLDLTNRRGYAVIQANRHGDKGIPHSRSVSVEFEGVSGPDPHAITNIVLAGAVGG